MTTDAPLQNVARKRKPATAPETTDKSLSPELAALLGMTSLKVQAEPWTPMDHALRWAKRKLYVFPCERFLGTPLVGEWPTKASMDRDQIITWWAQVPDADIAAVPHKSGHFVVVATAAEDGPASLAEFEEEHGPLPAEFRYENYWGDEHAWIKGEAVTSHHRLGRGLHVLGAGHFVYLPPSWAPDNRFEQE